MAIKDLDETSFYDYCWNPLRNNVLYDKKKLAILKNLIN